MAVDDHGLEVLKKSGEQVTPGDPSNLYIKVANKDGSLIGGGGSSGTQYTEGDVDASITGTALMAEEQATSTLKAVSTKTLGTQLTSSDQGVITNSMIHGLSSAGGGTFVDVKVDPSGAIQTFANQDTHDSLNANANIQVGNTDVSNANPVPVSDAGGSITIDASSLPLPTGASTAANQSTIIGHLDGVEGLLTTIDADTGNISTKIDTIAGAVSGTEVQVDIVTIPTVTVQDGGGSLTVDGSVSISGSVTVDSELTTADLDTGAGTDTRAVVGLVGSASGGGQLIPGSATDGLLVNLGTNNDVTVTGTVTANAGSGTFAVSAASLPLPSGASTLSEQQSQTTLLGTIDADTSTLAGAVSGTEMQVDIVTSALPSGASTAANQSTIIGHVDGIETLLAATNALLTTIDADTSSIASEDFATETTLAALNAKVTAVNTGAVVVSSSALPIGAATSANQSTIIGHLDGVEGLLTTIDADTSTLAGAVSGTEMQVDVVGALPTGNNVIGQVKVTNGTNAADVSALPNSNAVHVYVTDALGNQVTSFGGSNTQYTEDVAGIADPVGTFPLFIRKDTPSATVSDDGDAIAGRATDYGAQYVQVVNSSGSFVDSFGGSNTQYTEGDTNASITGTAAMWEDSADTLRAVSMDKPLPVQPGTSVAFPVTDNGASLTVDGTVAATQSGTWTLGANSGVDIGDVTINNASGASAVNIQDGGNSITVDGTVSISRTAVTTLEASYTAAQTNVAIVTVSAGTKIYVTRIKVANAALSPNVISYRIGFGTASTPTTTGVVASNPGMIPGFVDQDGDGSGVIGEGASDEELRITCDTPGSGGEIRVIVTYYTGAS